MAEALVVGPYDEEQVTTPSGGYQPGEIVQAPSGRAGYVVSQRPLEEGEPALLCTSGKVEIVSASGTTFTAGVTAEWHATNNLAVADAAGDFDLGTVARNKVSGETTVLILLNE